jgi:hypothetical protein
MHTYRDPKLLRNRFFTPLFLGFFALVVIFPFVPSLAFGSPFTQGAAVSAAFITGMVLISGYVAYRHEHYSSCGEIRLSDDGMCELETKRQVIRLHVNEIRSVEYWRDPEDNSESYTIRFLGGKLGVSERMTNFQDFVTRLKTLHPAVDLTTFPADGWPGLGGNAPGKAGPLNRLMRSALFPLVVIAALVYLAIHTLR